MVELGFVAEIDSGREGRSTEGVDGHRSPGLAAGQTVADSGDVQRGGERQGMIGSIIFDWPEIRTVCTMKMSLEFML